MVSGRGGAKLGTAVLELSTEDGKFTSGLNSAERKAGGSFSTIGKIGAAAFATVGVAAVAGLAGAVMASAEVEQRMNVLQQITGANADEMKALGKQAKALGADIKLPGTSAADAAEAMLELSKAGLSVNNTLRASRGVLQLSAAGQLSNAAAAEITANALNAFNLEGEEANRIADLLAASANASSVEVMDVGLAMKQSAAVFAAAGQPIEDMVTLIGQLGNAGIKGSDAGTSLRAMLLHLQAPAKQTAELMAEVGISAYDTAGNMKSMRDIVENVATATAGMTQEQRDFTLATIFGADAVRAINVLLSQGTAGFDKMKDATTKQGAAANLAAAYNKGLKGALDGMKSAAETLAITVGTPLLGALTNLANGASGWIGQIEPLAGLIKTGFSGGSIGGEWTALEQGAFNFGQAAKGAVEWLDKVMPSVETIRGIASDFASGIITGFGLARDTARDLWEWADKVMRLALEGDWMGAGAAMGEGLATGLGKVAGAGQRIGEAVLAWVQEVNWAKLGREAFKAAVPFIAGFAMALLDPIAWIQIINENKMLTAEVILAIIFMPAKWAGAIAKVLARIPLVGGFVGWMLTSLNAAGGPIRSGLQQMADDFGGVLWRGFKAALGLGDSPGIAAAIRRVVGNGIASAKDLADTFYLRALDWMEALGRGIGAHGPAQVVGAVRRLGSAIDDGAAALIEAMLRIGGQAVDGLARGITNSAGKVMDAARALANKLPGWVRDVLGISSPSRVFAEIGMQVGAGLALGVQQSGDEAAQAMQAAIDGVRTALRDEQVGAFFGDPAGVAAVRANQQTMLEEAGALANRLVETFGFQVPEAVEIAFAEVQRTAKSTADALIAERERLTQTLERIDNDFMMREIDAYLSGSDEKLAITKAQNAQMRMDAERIAADLVATYGIDLPTAFDKAMQHVIDSARAMEAATEAAAKKAQDVARGAGAMGLSLTKQLWSQAGPGTSPEVLMELNANANKAARAHHRAEVAGAFARGEIGMDEAQRSMDALREPDGVGTAVVKVELSSDLRIAGAP